MLPDDWAVSRDRELQGTVEAIYALIE